MASAVPDFRIKGPCGTATIRQVSATGKSRYVCPTWSQQDRLDIATVTVLALSTVGIPLMHKTEYGSTAQARWEAQNAVQRHFEYWNAPKPQEPPAIWECED